MSQMKNEVIEAIIERSKDPSYCAGARQDIEYLLYELSRWNREGKSVWIALKPYNFEGVADYREFREVPK
jgi:hypothetical protein